MDGSHAKRSKLVAVLLPPVLNVADSVMADSPVFVQWNGTKSRPNLQKIVLYFLENTMKKQESSVYEVLREKILSLELKQGQELNINQLAKEMDVSRSPIRDALLRLSLDKLNGMPNQFHQATLTIVNSLPLMVLKVSTPSATPAKNSAIAS